MAANGEEYSGAEAETSFEVRLYIYDLSKELSKSFKKVLKGKPLPDFWHTGLVAYGREYYFASSGIESCRPGETILGEPDQILTLGKTELPYSVFLEYIFALGESSYKPGTYNLLEHNCNSFSQEVSNFLTGGPIPQELRELPNEILGNKTLSNTLKEYFDKLCLRAEGSKGISFSNISSSTRRQLQNEQEIPRESNGEVVVNGQASHPPAVKSSKNHSKKETQPNPDPGQKKSKMPSVNGVAVPSNGNADETEAVLAQSEPVNASPAAPTNEVPSSKPAVTETKQASNEAPAADGQRTNEVIHDSANSDRSPDEAPLPTFTSRRSRKYPEPAILFPDVDGAGSYERIMATVGDKLSYEEKQAMSELLEYLTSPDGGAWALGAPHLDAIGRLLNDRNLPEEIPVLALKVLEAAALKEDVILLLHQDREHHHVMSYLFRTESLPEAEQEHIATFMCNLCSNTSSFDWLMYISEWIEEDGRGCNNSRVTVRVAVHSLLANKPSIQEKGLALTFNLALKELFDDVATELAMAVLQFLQSDLNEEAAFRSLTALFRFMCISYNEVPALMKMLGPDVRKFGGMSERVDQLVDQIQAKLSVAISV